MFPRHSSHRALCPPPLWCCRHGSRVLLSKPKGKACVLFFSFSPVLPLDIRPLSRQVDQPRPPSVPSVPSWGLPPTLVELVNASAKDEID
ncbi:hypothetical protein CGRA01v4_14983 [Colletotrichum graminicola]|nr:hypothetical protein CGRA01v4_14983 [Colletotrichum graminicola]